jgi:hypothetical protein
MIIRKTVAIQQRSRMSEKSRIQPPALEEYRQYLASKKLAYVKYASSEAMWDGICVCLSNMIGLGPGPWGKGGLG